MENAHLDEFRQLQDEALLRLRVGVRRTGYVQQVRATILPTFEDNHSYALMYPDRRNRGDLALVVKTTWKRSIDVEKFADPLSRLKHGVCVRRTPTIEEAESQISKAQFDDFFARLTELKVPPFIVKEFIALDGTTYELAFRHYHIRSSFAWWCEAPAAWRPLEALSQEIVELVDAAIAKL